ncbi:MAG TPA: thioredoxin family protein [Bacteroidetes bacterium]|nr:thioredoxin family protein [Bacteroidota bacterium]
MKIKILLAFTFVVLFSINNYAQNNWKLDYDEALELAKIEKKPVLILFTGSDWCPPCKRLHSAIFHSAEFENWAKDHLILVLADFPRRRENQLPKEQKIKNNNLAKKFGLRGFPTVFLVNNYGKILDKKVGYGGESPKEYIQNIIQKTNSIH